VARLHQPALRRVLRATLRSARRAVGIGVLTMTAACGSAQRPAPGTVLTDVPEAGAPRIARLPRDASRFVIEVVDDSTARFKPREAAWVREGMMAYAVDPVNRDALVAQLRITSVWNGMAVALVTSQVTRVTSQHVIALTPPPTPWWRARRFWTGMLVGSLLGGAVGGVIGVVTTP
jgi:hypothetical protein